jgi:hypothetical protein
MDSYAVDYLRHNYSTSMEGYAVECLRHNHWMVKPLTVFDITIELGWLCR